MTNGSRYRKETGLIQPLEGFTGYLEMLDRFPPGRPDRAPEQQGQRAQQHCLLQVPAASPARPAPGGSPHPDAPAPLGRLLRGAARPPPARGRAVPNRAVWLSLPACVYNFVLLPVVVRRRDVEVGGEQGDRLLGRAAAADGLGAGGSLASRRLLAGGAGALPFSHPSPLKGRLFGAEGAGAAGTMQQRCFFLS